MPQKKKQRSGRNANSPASSGSRTAGSAGEDHESRVPWLAPGDGRYMGMFFVLGLLVRLAFLWDYSGNPTFTMPLVDEFTHDERAWLLADKGSFHYDFFWQPIFYPLFLTGVYEVFGHSVVAARVIQMLLGACTCGLTYLFGRQLFDRRVGIIAASITVAYGPLMFFEQSLVAVVWAALLSLVLLMLLIRADRYPGVKLFLAIGFVGVISILNRPTMLPFFVFAMAWLTYRTFCRLDGIQTFRCTVAWLVSFFAVALPASQTMKREVGVASITPHSGGVNFYIGNNPNTRNTINIRPGWEWANLLKMPDREGIREPAARQRYFYNKTREYAVKNPAAFLGGMLDKTMKYVSTRELPRNEDIYTMRQWSGMLSTLVWKIDKFGFPFGVLMPLTFIGICLAWNRIPAYVYLFILLYPAAVILVFVSARYRVPTVPVLAVLAASGCVEVAKRVRSKAWAQLAMPAVVGGLSLLLGVAPGLFAEEQVDYQAEMYLSLGVSYRTDGDDENAREMYLKAREMNPELADASTELGSYWFRRAVKFNADGEQDQFEDALSRAEKENLHALKISPDHPVAYRNLAAIAKARGDDEQQVEFAQQAIDRDPSDAHTHYLLGLAFAEKAARAGLSGWQRGQLNQQSLEALKQAVELAPLHGKARYKLAERYYVAGNVERAVEQLQWADRARNRSAPVMRLGAWIMSTDAKFRDPRGLQLAKQACQTFGKAMPPPLYLDTLAAAYANAGDFQRAVQIAEQSLRNAREQQQMVLAQQIQDRLRMYRAGKKFTQPAAR